jgi:DNA-binding NarL/FixJ family response regulator
MTQPPNIPPSFTLQLASSRWAVHAFFASLRARGLPALVVEPFDEEQLGHATVVAVDLAPNAAGSLVLCRKVRARWPALPVIVLLCCPEAVDPWQLRELLREGASVLDLEATAEEAVRALESVARGSSVIHLRLRTGQRALLRDILSGRETTSATKVHVLRLLTLGLPDHEIGTRLHLSPHTVKHHVDALRLEVGARNRIELAAWAGQNGFYANGAASANSALDRAESGP